MVRPNELSFARRGALSKLANKARGARPGHLVGRFVGLDEDDDHRAIVAFGDAEVSVLSGPHKLVPGALVAVEVDSTNAPTRITGPVTTRPEGLDADVPAPDAVTTMPELSWADKETLAQAVADLEDAQVELAKANALLTALGSAEDEEEITQALADYLDVPASEVTWSGNLYQTVLARLLVATGIITEDMIATGAITAPKLNIVYTDPERGYGFSLQPEGLTILDADGNPVIALRADMENAFTIMRDGEIMAAISPDGGISGRTVSASQSLTYRGDELADLLSRFSRGVLARSSNLGQQSALVGTNVSRVAAVSLTTPATNRSIRISFEGRVSNGTATRRPLFTLRQSENPYVRPTNTAIRTFYIVTGGNDEVNFSWTTTTGELNWPPGTPITVGIFAESQVTGESITFHQNAYQQLVIEDLGPAVEAQSHPPYVPSGGGGTATGTQDYLLWREQTRVFDPTWSRYWVNGIRYDNVGSHALRQGIHTRGAFPRVSQVGYDTAAISTFCAGATMLRARLRLNNFDASPNAGNAFLWTHSRTELPATYQRGQFVAEYPWTKGQDKWVDISSVMDAIKAGTIRGFGLDQPDPERSSGALFEGLQLEITVRK